MLELPDDPYQGITAATAAVIDGFLMPDDSDETDDHVEAFEILLTEISQLVVEDADVHEWFGDLKGGSWSAVRDAAGSMRKGLPSDDGSGLARTTVPPQVVAVLVAILEIADDDDRYIALDSIDAIWRETRAMWDDEEKLYGHLFLAHKVPLAEIAESNDSRTLQHAALHSAGKRHSPSIRRE